MKIESLDCPHCGSPIPENIQQGLLFKCNGCGSTLVWPERRSVISLSFGTYLCPQCGTDNEQERKFCRSCGTLLKKICPKCKANYYVGDSFCPNGHNYEQEKHEIERIKQQKSLVRQQERLKKAEYTLRQAYVAYERGASYKNVLRTCLSALSLNPNLAEAYFLQGVLLEDMGKQDDAIIAYRKVLQIDPANNDAEEALHEIESKYKKGG